MYLRAGVFSLGLLLISRLLGLARESAQAAAFGTSGMGDVVIVMFTLPDLLVGVLFSGALSYVLLPAWARQAQSGHMFKLTKLAVNLGLAALVAGGLLWVFRGAVVQALAPGLRGEMRALSIASIGWSAAVLPLAMIAALWATRLQHERDFLGLYAGNVLVNMVLVAGLVAVGGAAWAAGTAPATVVATLGGCLVLAMLLRLLWLAWRLSKATTRLSAPASIISDGSASPAASVWLWAALASSLVLLLPLVARSVVSQAGEGALAGFNYAWKLIELPLVLALQLVASLAFPALAATGPQSPERLQALQVAFALAWALACAAAAVVATFSLPLASVLFGWGSMTLAGLEVIAQWSAVGVWSLLPQALIAVLLTLMAITTRMRVAAVVYACALATLLVFGLFASSQGQGVMWALNAVLAAAAAALLVTERKDVAGALPLVAMAAPFLFGVMLVLLKPLWLGMSLSMSMIFACGYALLVLASGVASSPELRRLVLLKLKLT
jgi:putative peptidoglycan lipid II flippase